VKYEFDFEGFKPMLYVEVAQAIQQWDELRLQLKPFFSNVDLVYRARPKHK
jgi:hypothetical protein